ncbi:MAG: cation-transporting P-type ATPase [Actinomycetota bacterium]
MHPIDGAAGRDRARDGLTAEEAGARFDRFGPNEIPAGRRASWQRRFALQLLEPMSNILPSGSTSGSRSIPLGRHRLWWRRGPGRGQGTKHRL